MLRGIRQIQLAKDAGAEKPGQRRNSVKTWFLNAGQLALAHLRFISAGEVPGDRVKFGGRGALLTNLAHLPELSDIPKGETAPRFERAWSAAVAHLARDRRNLLLVKDELFKVNRGRLLRCAVAQTTDFAVRKKAEDSFSSQPPRSCYRAQKRLRPIGTPSAINESRGAELIVEITRPPKTSTRTRQNKRLGRKNRSNTSALNKLFL